MTQLTPMDLIRILGQVTLILVVSMVGGTVLGLVLDATLGTTPLLAVSGLVLGSLVAAFGIWLFIRRHPMSASRGYDHANDHANDHADGR
jgi:F0F1-type ATP synthase assembly protein I